MKYNVESDDSDGGKEVVAYVGHSDHSSLSSSDEEELHFSCEERKRCGRIVRSVVKELFKNEGVWGGSGDKSKLGCFSGEIWNFFQKDHEERLKFLSSHKDGEEKSFAARLKKCVKILCNANH